MKNPLLKLVGTWKGNQGTDIAPKPDEEENNPYYETLVIKPLDSEIENAEEQELLVVIYEQVVREKANDKISHSEVGYWIWEKHTNRIINSFTIPRGVCVLASGTIDVQGEEMTLYVSADTEDSGCSISQSKFMMKKAKTLSFKRTLKISGNTLVYSQETIVDIYGKTFEHTDTNTLKKVD